MGQRPGTRGGRGGTPARRPARGDRARQQQLIARDFQIEARYEAQRAAEASQLAKHLQAELEAIHEHKQYKERYKKAADLVWNQAPGELTLDQANDRAAAIAELLS